MLDQEKKDLIVIARKGYAVLLQIDGKTYDIDSYTPVNLSNMYSAETLEKSQSLAAHLKAGNLVFFEKGTKLSKDPTAISKIKPLREERAEHITAQYDQAARDSNRTNIELETRANITKETSDYIQEQVKAERDALMNKRKEHIERVVSSMKTTENKMAQRQNAMTPNELMMKVSMDVTPEKFAEKQAISKKNREQAEVADEVRAENEIAMQEIKNQDDAEQGE